MILVSFIVCLVNYSWVMSVLFKEILGFCFFAGKMRERN
jgi:hypothetical protein